MVLNFWKAIVKVNVSQETKNARLSKLVELVDHSNISSLKSTVAGVIRIINDPNSNAKNLKDLIQVDPPLAARVLRVANSAYYASPRKINEIDQAVIWMGFDTLKEIVLNQKVCEVFTSTETHAGFSRPLLWKHSLAVALLAKMIYRMEYGQRGENAYAIGLMHDLGIIVEDQFINEAFKYVLNESANQSCSLAEVESKVLGFNHSEIGEAVTRSWGFPEELFTAIRMHHQPVAVSAKLAKISKTLFIADYLSLEAGLVYCNENFSGEEYLDACLKDLDLKLYSLESLVKSMKEEIHKMEEEGFLGNE